MATESWSEPEALALAGRDRLPGVLRHLAAISEAFSHPSGTISYLHIYAMPSTNEGADTLEFVRAAESGTEGIACVDDVARAVLLACEVYEQEGTQAARDWAQRWLDFVLYMQARDGRFCNFILDRAGRKNRRGRTSYAGGQWWTSRAMWALAGAWRVLSERQYRLAFDLGRLAGTRDLKITAVQALALMELYRAEPEDHLGQRIIRRCDRLLASGTGYLRDRPGDACLNPWGFHQLQALARAGRLFSRPDYLAACKETVQAVVAPLIARRCRETEPWRQVPRCAYDLSTLVLGLEELYRGTHEAAYREMALLGAEWLYGRNPAGAALYDPETGSCADGIDGTVVSPNCGAESTIEAGFIELARRRLC